MARGAVRQLSTISMVCIVNLPTTYNACSPLSMMSVMHNGCIQVCIAIKQSSTETCLAFVFSVCSAGPCIKMQLPLPSGNGWCGAQTKHRYTFVFIPTRLDGTKTKSSRADGLVFIFHTSMKGLNETHLRYTSTLKYDLITLLMGFLLLLVLASYKSIEA